jgi:glycosyltransferase involved in cell wall biosynthesis
MKLIINTSNMVVGGSIQVSLSLIEELKNYTENEYHIFLSPSVNIQIDTNSFGDNFHFYLFNTSPSSIRDGTKIRQRLNKLENIIKPDVVFTVFGPAFWTPKSLHVSGYANGWCYNPNSIAFKKFHFLKRLKFKVSIFFRNILIKRANYLIVETETAKKNIVKYLNIDQEKIFVVGNTFHQVYNDILNEIQRTPLEREEFKLLVLSAYYPHKNLNVINDVSIELAKNSNVTFKFYLTLPDEIFQKHFGANSQIENLGVQEIKNCPKLYGMVDALFLPTLLETFTANYPEAMKMEKPILTSDLDFAHELCGNAALYFNPLDSVDIAKKVIILSQSPILYNELVDNGRNRLNEYETSSSRTSKYLEIFRKVANTA